jgi:hypothetical protein
MLRRIRVKVNVKVISQGRTQRDTSITHRWSDNAHRLLFFSQHVFDLLVINLFFFEVRLYICFGHSGQGFPSEWSSFTGQIIPLMMLLIERSQKCNF